MEGWVATNQDIFLKILREKKRDTDVELMGCGRGQPRWPPQAA
jgi:hypothetical protein